MRRSLQVTGWLLSSCRKTCFPTSSVVLGERIRGTSTGAVLLAGEESSVVSKAAKVVSSKTTLREMTLEVCGSKHV
jgi:hypothetical protein